jgi:hypothetical protein
MKNLTRFGAMGMLLLSLVQSAGQQGPTIVNLTVIHNGRKRPAPAEIRASFGAHSLRIPLRDGRFEVPPELTAAPRVTLDTYAEGDHIRITHITGTDFTQEDWTLVLADRAYDDEYQWAVPKGASVRASCMLAFESVHTDPGRVLYERHCRSKNKQGSSR